jgi:HEAT repeat protein
MEQAMHLTRHILWTIAILCVAASTSWSQDLSLDDVFARTARFKGDSYRAARNILERQGEKLVPFLKEKTKSEDWQERDLARALLLRLEQPALAKIYHRLQSWRHHTVTARDGGKFNITWDTEEAKQAKQDPEQDVLIDESSLPLLLEMLREIADEANHSSHHAAWDRALTMAGHFAAADSAPALVHWYAAHWRGRERMPGVLVKIGPPALPWLRDVIREGSWLAGPGAVKILARIGDRDEGAALLLEKLKVDKADHMTEPAAAALAEMKITAALPLIWAQLHKSVELARKQDHSSGRPSYHGLRKAITEFGKDALVFLKEKSAPKASLRDRVIAGGMLHEMENAEAVAAFYRRVEEAAKEDYSHRAADFWQAPLGWSRWHDIDIPAQEDTPLALLLERTHIFATVPDLRALSQHKNSATAYEVVAEAVGGLNFAQAYPAALKALARFHDERAIAVYRMLFDGPENYYVMHELPEVLLELGSPKGAAILEDLLLRADKEHPKGQTYRPVADLARTILPALKGDPQQVVKLLEHQSGSVRETAALYLAARNDARAVPVLLRQAAGEAPNEVLGFQAQTDMSPQHVTLRDAIVQMGKSAVPALEKVQKETQSWRTRLLCEACIQRIGAPKLAATFQKTARAANTAVSQMMIPDYSRGGAILSGVVGKKGLPLIESALAFNTDVFAPSAAYALGNIKEERSIPVIIQSMPYVYGYSRRAENIGAHVLHMFGEKGIEAAKKIPPPDPNKAHFAERAMRHRGVTETLAFEKEIKGVENIVDGLKLPRPAKEGAEFAAWSQRMQAYLRISHRYHDKRLFEPMLALTTVGDKDLDMAALFALKDYKDQRIVDRAVPYLGKTHKEHRYADPMVTVLAHQLGEDIGPFLAKRFVEGSAESRIEAAYALGDFAAHEHTHWPDGNDREKMAEVVKKLRKAAVEPMRLALDDKNDAVNTAVALNLVKVDHYSEPVAIALAGWLTRQKEPPTEVIHFLRFSKDSAVMDAYLTIYPRSWKDERGSLRQAVVQQLAASKDPKIGPALLKLYRAGPDSHLAWAMGELKITDAIDNLANAARRYAGTYPSSYGRYKELEAWCRLGAAGRAKAYALFKEGGVNLRVETAHELTLSTPPSGLFKEVVPTWDTLIVNPPGKDDRPYQYRHHYETLLEVLVRLDKKQGYVTICRSLFQSPDETTRHHLATRILRLEQETPALCSQLLTLKQE